MRFHRYIGNMLLIFAVIYFAAGCEDTGVTDTGNNHTGNLEEVELMPLIPSEMEIENDDEEETPTYACRISTLADEEADYNYWNQTFRVRFPEGVAQESDQTTFKTFSYSSAKAGEKAGSWGGQSNIVRVAQCIIPDHEQAEKLLDERLTKFGENTWLKSITNKKFSDDELNDWVCNGDLYTIMVCQYNEDSGEYDDCYEGETQCSGYWEYEVEEDPGSGGGGGSGDPSDDPGDCDPTGTIPCFDDGDGGSQPANPDPCEGDDPPAYCSDPCEGTGTSLDEPSIQMVLENLWSEQESTNKEQAGFIYENSSGDYVLNHLADHLVIKRTYESITFRKPSNLPSNAIYVHTHPTQETLSKFGVTREYQNRPSEDDYDAMEILNLAKGFILDPDQIIIYNSEEILDTIDRCGY